MTDIGRQLEPGDALGYQSLGYPEGVRPVDPAFDRAWWDMAAQDQQKQMMQTYITTKIIQAVPSEKDGQQGYAVFYPDGYASWCPKAEFERTARPVSAKEAGFIAGDAQDA